MQRIPRAIAIGLLAGAILFFVPFVIGFVLFILLAGIALRFLFGFNRRGHFRGRSFIGHDPYAPHSNIVPIDRQWYNAPIEGNGPEKHFPIQ